MHILDFDTPLARFCIQIGFDDHEPDQRFNLDNRTLSEAQVGQTLLFDISLDLCL